MLVQVVSDLHTESRRDVPAALADWRDPKAETLIIAGDACNWKSGRQLDALLKAVEGWRWVLYAPGNHEYYDSDPGSATLNAIDAFVGTNVGVAYSPGFFEFGGHRFLVGTMWFPRAAIASMKGAVPDKGQWWEGNKSYQFSDFFYTKGLGPWCYEQNAIFGRCLNCVNPGDVVVSHHLPSYQSVPKQYQTEPDNAFYVSASDSQIALRQPQVWIHGHTHTPFDYRLGATRVVANPLGYVRERKTSEYKPLLLELAQ